MKKILSLALIIVMLFAFVSCAAKPDKYEENLEDKDYEVEVIDDEDDLEDAVDVFVEMYDLDVDGGLKWALEAYNIEEREGVSIYCFEKSSDAKNVAKDLEDAFEEMEGADMLADMVVEQDGKLLFVASSKGAIKDAKGK